MTTPGQLVGCAASAAGGLTNLTANVCPSGPGSILVLDAPGFCPLCLERYIDGRDGGAKTQLIEEVVDGVKTGNWICPDGGTRLRRARQAVLRPSPLGAQNLAGLLVRHRPDRGRDGTPGLRSPTHSLRRTRLTGDLLHDLDGALAHERHWVSVVAHAVARDAAGGVGGVETRRRERLSWYTWCTYASLRLSESQIGESRGGSFAAAISSRAMLRHPC